MAAFQRAILGMASVFLLLVSGPANGAWRRAETDHFILYGEIEEGRLREQAVVLEEFDRLLRLLTGVDAASPPNKLPVYLVYNHDRLRLVRDVSYGVGGFYLASPDGIGAFVNQRTNVGRYGPNDTLFHEYAHHFMLQYFPAGYPAWYVEGFAEYVATADFRSDILEFGRYNDNRSLWLSDKSRWIPYEHVLFGGDRKPQWGDSARFYAQSWILVHYLMSDPARAAATRAYLSALSAGEEPRTAFQSAFGMPASDLDARIRAYAREGIAYTRAPRGHAVADPVITTLPTSSDELMLLQAVMRVGVPEKARKAVLERTRREARGKEDPFARRILAQAEALYGNAAAADGLLGELLQASPNDAELLYLKGMRYLTAGRADEAARAAYFAEAKGWFVKAHKADPNHFPTLYRYAEALSVEPDYLSENTTNILLLARSLAPQVAEIGIQAGQALLLREEYDAARAVLTPIAASVHHPQSVAAAETLLQAAKSRRPLDERVGFDLKDPEQAGSTE